MVQQINLINPALLKKRDLLGAVPLAIAAGVVLIFLLVVFAVVRQQADVAQVEADKRAKELTAAQARLAEVAKTVADSQADPGLTDELAHARAMLNLREDVISLLEGGAFGNKAGFSEYLRGFARQTPSDLWLTGFVLNGGGTDMEIRGRMMKPAALPEFILKLNSEKTFQGLGFSSLVIDRPMQLSEQKSGGVASGQPQLAPFAEFVLRSKLNEGEIAASGKPSSRAGGR